MSKPFEELKSEVRKDHDRAARVQEHKVRLLRDESIDEVVSERDERLLQEILLDSNGPKDTLYVRGWRMLIGCMLLNQTGRKQVDRVWPTLFKRWPDPWAMSVATVGEVQDTIRSLGLSQRRAENIKRFTEWWNSRGLGFDLRDAPGCGQYAKDSWDIFVLRELEVEPEDKELKRYVMAQKAESPDATGANA